MKGKLTTSQIFELMVEQPGSAEGRDAAIAGIKYLDYTEVSALRNRMVDAANPESSDHSDFKNPINRGYILGQLGKIAGDNPDALNLLQTHVTSDKEPNEWVRFWALSGCYYAKVKKNVEIARWIINHYADKDPAGDFKLVLLSHAILAEQTENPGHVDFIKDALIAWASLDTNVSEEEFKLRLSHTQDALRVIGLVSVPAVTDLVIQALEKKGADPRMKYLATQALASIDPGNHKEAEKASKALVRLIENSGNARVMSSVRQEALKALGVLKDPASEFTLLKELSSGSLSHILVASRSLAQLMGIETAVLRVLENAQKDDNPFTRKNYSIALRWMSDDKGAVADAIDVQISSGNLEQQENARLLLAEMGGAEAMDKLAARTKVVEDYKRMLLNEQDKFQELFDKTMHEARVGFKIAIGMDVSVFMLGVIILLVAAGVALFKEGSLDKFVGAGAGGVGVLGIVYGTLISNPRKKVFRSVNALMNFKVVFLAYLRQLHQADQAFTRNMLDEDGMPTEMVSDFSNLIKRMEREAVEKMVKLKNQELDEKKADYKYENMLKELDVKQRMAEVEAEYGKTNEELDLEEKLRRLEQERDQLASKAAVEYISEEPEVTVVSATGAPESKAASEAKASGKKLAPSNWDETPY